MNNSVNNLFVAISPSHIENCEALIEFKTVKGNNILLNPGNYPVNTMLWDEIIVDTINLNYREDALLKKLKYQIYKLYRYKKYIKAVQKKVNLANITNYYYFNLDDILSNHLFHYLNLNTNVVIEDGILNYYSPVHNKASKLKKLLTKFFRLKFIPPNQHPTNIYSNKVVKQYVRLPERSILPSKSSVLPFNKTTYNSINGLFLIIGQDIMSHAEGGIKHYEMRLNELCSLISKKTFKKVIYKPHRNGDVSIAKKILPEYFENLEFFEDNTPIESCVFNIKPAEIFSFESSAMLNLKLSITNSMVKLSVLPYFANETEVTQLYRNLEIIILKNDE